MKRFHVHVAVDDLDTHIHIHSSLFGSEPTMRKNDCAKWMLDDPRANFAVSRREDAPRVNHLGIPAEKAASVLTAPAAILAAKSIRRDNAMRQQKPDHNFRPLPSRSWRGKERTGR